eukprot:scaffold229113_cov26-Tisochrysis_lutea.AAC.3
MWRWICACWIERAGVLPRTSMMRLYASGLNHLADTPPTGAAAHLAKVTEGTPKGFAVGGI